MRTGDINMGTEHQEYPAAEVQLKEFRAKILKIRESLKDGNLGDKKFDITKLGYEEMALFDQYKKLCELVLGLDENTTIAELNIIDEMSGRLTEKINSGEKGGDLFRGFLLNQLAFIGTLSMYKVEPENKAKIIKETQKMIELF